ncbi:MAG: hypothetical protein N2039_08520 [Gemmataceae bacterium]|nr:hypothetical protein [Gemmataceae bacterium]
MVRQPTPLSLIAVAVAAFLALTAQGCALKERRSSSTSVPAAAAAPTVKPPKAQGPPVEMLANWHKQIQVGMDPVSQSPIAAITGRLYLFDATGGHPIGGDGNLSVELYENSADSNGKPKQLETWKFDSDALKQCAKIDNLGYGYSLALPWSTYRPEIQKIHMVVKFEPKEGTPLTTMSHVISLDHDQPHHVAKMTGKKLGSNVVQTSASD